MYKNALDKYLDDLASRKPAPGGGSAAALTASLGVSLISMVCNFTIGKERYRIHEQQIKEVLLAAENLRQKLTNLVDEDVKVYGKLAQAYKLPKDKPEDRRKRQHAIQEGLKEALATPLEVCRCCHEAIKLCPVVAGKGNEGLISDVGVAAALLQAAFQSALMNVDINLRSLKEKKFILEIREILEPMEQELGVICKQVEREAQDILKRSKY